MRVRYPFAGSFAALMLLSGYLGLSDMRTSAINDKLLHFIVFFLLTATLYWSVELPRRLLMKAVLGFAAVSSVASEFLQQMLDNGREFDAADIAANLLGSVLALGLCQWYHKRMLERKRRRKLEGYGLVSAGEGAEDLELGEGPGPSLDERGVIAEEEEEEEDNEAWDSFDAEAEGAAKGSDEPAKANGES